MRLKTIDLIISILLFQSLPASYSYLKRVILHYDTNLYSQKLLFLHKNYITYFLVKILKFRLKVNQQVNQYNENGQNC